MNKVIKIILGVLLSILLTVVAVIEFYAGFNMLKARNERAYKLIVKSATESGLSRVTIEADTVYPEIDTVVPEGEVFAIPETNVRVKVPGKLVMDDFEDEFFNRMRYIPIEEVENLNKAPQLSSYVVKDIFHTVYQRDNPRYATLAKAYDEFWKDNPELLRKEMGIDYDPYTFYQQSYRDYRVAVICFNNEKYWYCVKTDTEFTIIECDAILNITHEKATVRYGNPTDNPQYNHTYSFYESHAAENTRRELLDEDSNKDSKNPYVSGDVIGTAETYTAEADNVKRKQLTKLGDYVWGPDGTCAETSSKVDITSATAKQSQWTLSSTVYSFTQSGLKLSGLSAKKNDTEFTVTGNINNLLKSERPYVIIVKYLDESNSLLGLTVIDKRSEPLASEGVAKFTSSFVKSDKQDPMKVNAVQFEVH